MREPQLLRQLGADADFATVAALLSRTCRPEQRANVKATSFTSELADRLVPAGLEGPVPLRDARTPISRASSPARIAGRRLQALSAIRLARLQGRCPGLAADLGTMHDGLRAALGWACEMTSLERGRGRASRGQRALARFRHVPRRSGPPLHRHRRSFRPSRSTPAAGPRDRRGAADAPLFQGARL